LVNKDAGLRLQALPKNQTFFGFGLLHLTPALLGSQSAPAALAFCFDAFSDACRSSLCVLVELESWAEAGTTKADASSAAHMSLFIHAPL
jgi:hypothetical protein